ncbi:unnamed protein product [Fusarium graminearum]|nr:unnamed protein product [Fusarium graminearum]
MRSTSIKSLAACLTLPFLSHGFTVIVDNESSVENLVNAIFSDPGLTVTEWDKLTAAGSSGSFTDGPFGIGAGGILTTGGNGNIDNGFGNQGQLDYICDATDTQNAAVVYGRVKVNPGYNGVRLEFIFTTNEPFR